MIILPPQAEFCDCVYDFILHMLDKKPDQTYTNLCEHTQQERCQLSECDVVKNFRIPTKDNSLNQQTIPSIDESIIDTAPPKREIAKPQNKDQLDWPDLSSEQRKVNQYLYSFNFEINLISTSFGN